MPSPPDLALRLDKSSSPPAKAEKRAVLGAVAAQQGDIVGKWKRKNRCGSGNERTLRPESLPGSFSWGLYLGSCPGTARGGSGPRPRTTMEK